MTASFAQIWTISGRGETIEINGQIKTFRELRQQSYENIIDETLFISRASEGAVSAEWVQQQPIFIRKKYVEAFQKELKEREQRLKRKNHK